MAFGEFIDPDKKVSDKRPKIKLPSDYEDEAAFLADMRECFYQDIQVDRLNRDAALEDLRFMAGDQWQDVVRQRREASRKPTLTINRLPAFVAQVVGQRRLNETQIKIIPDTNGQTDAAKIREGLLRSIQKLSRADLAYDKALENQVICGIGNFKVDLAWESNDVWTQKIQISAIPDPIAVVWDRSIQDPTGSDAGHVFVIDTLTKGEFYKRWPWATPADIAVDMYLRGDLRMTGWISADDVRVVTYWRMRHRKRTLALMRDGSTRDITDDDPEQVLPQIVQRQDGTPIMREVHKPYAEMYVCSGLDILDGPYELPISRVPVFRVPGWEVWVGEWKQRWGLIRFLKDPMRLHNYWRSVVAEKIMQTPRAVWAAADTAVAGRETRWRQSHLSDDPLLIWNAESGQKPERVPPAQIENSLLQQAEMTTQDIKDVSNIHEANLGMPSNEVSGAAIMARQRVSDTGTIIYHDNLNQAIEQAGIVINELIPVVYDTPRIVQVIGEDASTKLQVINDIGNPESVDLTAGKYRVSVVTGPSYATKRMEALQAMVSLANAAPQLLATFADLYVQAQDWPLADQIAKRIRSTLPPGMLDPKDLSPDEQQQMQSKAQAGQQQAQMAQAEAESKIQANQASAALAAARAHNYIVEAALAPAKLQNESVTTASQAAQRELQGSLDAIKTGS